MTRCQLTCHRFHVWPVAIVFLLFLSTTAITSERSSSGGDDGGGAFHARIWSSAARVYLNNNMVEDGVSESKRQKIFIQIREASDAEAPSIAPTPIPRKPHDPPPRCSSSVEWRIKVSMEFFILLLVFDSERFWSSYDPWNIFTVTGSFFFLLSIAILLMIWWQVPLIAFSLLLIITLRLAPVWINHVETWSCRTMGVDWNACGTWHFCPIKEWPSGFYVWMQRRYIYICMFYYRERRRLRMDLWPYCVEYIPWESWLLIAIDSWYTHRSFP